MAIDSHQRGTEHPMIEVHFFKRELVFFEVICPLIEVTAGETGQEKLYVWLLELSCELDSELSPSDFFASPSSVIRSDSCAAIS